MIGLWSGLLLAHLLYDFHWQGDFVGVLKAENKFIMFIHCLTWALLMVSIMSIFGLGGLPYIFIYLLVTHWIIDAWKCRQPKETKFGKALIIDQIVHVATVVLAVYTLGRW